MTGAPVAIAMPAVVVVYGPAAVDPSADGNGVVVAVAATVVSVMTVARVVTVAAVVVMVVFVEDRTDNQSSDEASDKSSSFAICLGGRCSGGSDE